MYILIGVGLTFLKQSCNGRTIKENDKFHFLNQNLKLYDKIHSQIVLKINQENI